jgi:hypothetical protein
MQSSYVQWILEEIKKSIPTTFYENDVQLNKMDHNVDIKKKHTIQYALTFIINKPKMFP